MKTTGLEFHQVFWSTIHSLEALRHPTMEIALLQPMHVASLTTGVQAFSVKCRSTKARAVLNSHGRAETDLMRQKLRWQDYEESGNFYLTLQYEQHVIPRDMVFDGLKPYLAADVLYYWFCLSLGESGGPIQRRLLNKWDITIQGQMQNWFNTVDAFHKYALLHE